MDTKTEAEKKQIAELAALAAALRNKHHAECDSRHGARCSMGCQGN